MSTPQDTRDITESSYEQSLEELESVVNALESGDLPLDDMIDRYERGMQLIASCQKRLAEAELRVTEIAADSANDDDDVDMDTIPF